MKRNLMKLANPNIFDVQPYLPGKPVLECQREFGLTHFIKLSCNENPVGASPKVAKAIVESLSSISLYPDTQGYELRKLLAQKYDMAFDNVLVGNGSEEILQMLLQVFIIPGQEVIFGQYSFMGYEILSKAVGAHVKKSLMPNWKIDFDEILKIITPQTKMILLANPNNPTGTYFNEHEFKQFLSKVPSNILVVCDEAYYEYIKKEDYPQTHQWLSDYPNLIITRSFSKAYGLAGLRVGYMMAHEDITALVNRIRQPFNVNTLAQTAAIAALQDEAFMQRSVEINAASREQLYEKLTDLGLTYIPSEANFIMIHVNTDAYAVYEALLRKGIIIRPMRYYHLQHYIRVSIGTEEDNRAFVEALAQILNKELVA